MAHLNILQQEFLVSFIESYVKDNPNDEKTKVIKELDIIGGLNKHAWLETIREDVEWELQSMQDDDGSQLELTPQQMERVLVRMSNYDYSSYVESIHESIHCAREEII